MGKLPDGQFEDANGNPGTYRPSSTESKRDRAVDATRAKINEVRINRENREENRVATHGVTPPWVRLSS